MRLLIDMDGVITNYDKGFLDKWRKAYPKKSYIPLAERTTFYVKDQYPEEDRVLIERITTNPYFFYDLEVIPGSRKALEEMVRKGLEVFICTSPMTDNLSAASEKLSWIEKYFGPEWKKRTIITKDKTMIRGDILIDDRAEISGVDEPTWEHVHYAYPYNFGFSNRRLDWENWQEVLGV